MPRLPSLTGRRPAAVERWLPPPAPSPSLPPSRSLPPFFCRSLAPGPVPQSPLYRPASRPSCQIPLGLRQQPPIPLSLPVAVTQPSDGVGTTVGTVRLQASRRRQPALFVRCMACRGGSGGEHSGGRPGRLPALWHCCNACLIRANPGSGGDRAQLPQKGAPRISNAGGHLRGGHAWPKPEASAVLEPRRAHPSRRQAAAPPFRHPLADPPPAGAPLQP